MLHVAENFYRTMPCITRTVLSLDVDASVRLFVTRRYSVGTAKHIITLFHLRVARPF